MLLTVAPNGFQLGGGTESESTFNTNEFQASDESRSCAAATSSRSG